MKKILLFAAVLTVSVAAVAQQAATYPIKETLPGNEGRSYRVWNFPCKAASDAVACELLGDDAGVMLIDFNVEGDSVFTFWGGKELTATTFKGQTLVGRRKVENGSKEFLTAYAHRDSCYEKMPPVLDQLPLNGLAYKGKYKDMKVYFGADYYVGGPMTQNKKHGWVIAFVNDKDAIIGLRAYRITDLDHHFDTFPCPVITKMDEYAVYENPNTNMQLLKDSHLYCVGWDHRVPAVIKVVDIDLEAAYDELF